MFGLGKKELKVHKLAKALEKEGFTGSYLEVEIRNVEDWGYDFYTIKALLGSHTIIITVYEDDKLYQRLYDTTIHLAHSGRENLGIIVKTAIDFCKLITDTGFSVYLPELGYIKDEEEEPKDEHKHWFSKKSKEDKLHKFDDTPRVVQHGESA